MKIFIGKVVSKKMEKTATVAVTRIVVHPVYKKRYRKTKKYQVHDDLGVKKGEGVKFVASRPVSKLKKWKIIEVLEKKEKSGKKKSQKAGKKKEVKSSKKS